MVASLSNKRSNKYHRWLAGAQPGIFQGRGNFWKLGHFVSQLIYNIRIKDPKGKSFGDFFPRCV